ncbi:MAG: 30S ribosomal protein S6 [Arsenophonus sp.]|nr:MAG: 30S ribosomal protein S6 [Arsenophonus sp.]
MIHPEYSEKVTSIINSYTEFIINENGKIYRSENWGRRQLAYTINKLHKAHYFLMNIKAKKSTVADLEKKIRFNDAIIRSLILKVKNSITIESPMLKNKEKNLIVSEQKKLNT